MWSDSEGEEPLSYMDAIDHIETLLQQLKEKVRTGSSGVGGARITDVDGGGNNEFSAAAAVMDEGEQICNVIDWMRKQAQSQAEEVGDQLFEMLRNFHVLAGGPGRVDEFWRQFTNKLESLETAALEFRTNCLWRSNEQDGEALIHKVCKLDPPPCVVKRLIQITPTSNSYIKYNHLAISDRVTYPLHMVMRHGGSFELVKLLVDLDDKKKTLMSCSAVDNSVYHELAAHKHVHEPKVFSNILRHLVHAAPRNVLLHKNMDRKTPLALLWENLQEKGGMSDLDIIQNEDIKFLLQEMCHHHSLAGTNYTDSNNNNNNNQTKHSSPLLHRFVACFPCLKNSINNTTLENIIACNKTMLFEKDSEGKLLFHQIVGNRSFLIDNWCSSVRIEAVQIITDTVLKVAPEVAQLTCGDNNLLPLHIVADSKRVPYLEDHERLALVKSIWKAYPEANGILDQETGLPPFGLPRRMDNSQFYSTISTSFFLLRQCPEMLFVSGGNMRDNSQRSVKRQRTVNVRWALQVQSP